MRVSALSNTRCVRQVPAVAPGDYVLSFRWDCEQTSQIWNGCSSIRIV